MANRFDPNSYLCLLNAMNHHDIGHHRGDGSPRSPHGCAPSATRGARPHGLARPRRARLQLPASDLAAALGVAQLEKLDEMLERRSAVAARYAQGWPGSRASGADRRARRTERRSWSSTPVRLPEGADRDATIARLGRAGVVSQGLPACIHLFPPPARARLARGPVPGRRSRLGSLAGAAVLPLDDRVAGGAGVRGSRPDALTANRR